MLRQFLAALSFIRPYVVADRLRLAGYLSSLFVSTALAVLAPFTLLRAVDDGLTRSDVPVALGWIGLGALLGILSAACQSASGIVGAIIGTRVTEAVRCDLYRHVLAQSYSFHGQSRSGALTSRLARDPVELQGLVQQTLGTFVGQGITLVCAAVAVGWTSPVTLVAVLVTIPLFVLPARHYASRTWQAARDQATAHADLQHCLGESVGASGALTRELFATQARDAEYFAVLAGKSRQAGVQRNTAFHRAHFFTLAISGLCVAAVYAIGALGGASVGHVVALAALVGLIYAPDRGTTRLRRPASYGDGAAHPPGECAAIRRRPLQPSGTRCGHPARSRGGGDLGQRRADHHRTHLPDLARSYDGGGGSQRRWEDHRRSPGGAGARPDTGEDHPETDLADIDPGCFHRLVGMVTQDAHLLHATLRENLLLAASEASDAELVVALDVAQLAFLVDRLPDGLDTMLGDRGVRLSGGERQRLSLARVVLADPDIVIFDEATAHLDSVTEQALHTAMADRFAGRTQLVIAHRAETIARADVVIGLDRGRVA